MVTKEYLLKNNINSDYCSLWWLAGFTLEDWRKLPTEIKEGYAKTWNRKPPEKGSSGWGNDPSPRWDHCHIEGSCSTCY